MWFRIFGSIGILIGIIELYFSKQAFQHLKERGNRETPPFMLYGLWSSVVFGIMIILIGLAGILNKF